MNGKKGLTWRQKQTRVETCYVISCSVWFYYADDDDDGW